MKALSNKNLGVKKETIFFVGNSKKLMEAFWKMLGSEGEKLRIRLAAVSHLGEWSEESNFLFAMRVAKNKTFSEKERMMIINVLGLGKDRRGSRNFRGGVPGDREENYSLRFEARKALRVRGGRK